jgi:hypothetical protein
MTMISKRTSRSADGWLSVVEEHITTEAELRALAEVRSGAPAACQHPHLIDITAVVLDLTPTAVCTGCGQCLGMDYFGRWVITEGAPITEGDQTPGG